MVGNIKSTCSQAAVPASSCSSDTNALTTARALTFEFRFKEKPYFSAMENTSNDKNKYHNTKIYKITDNTHNEQYMGSTVDTLSSRMSSHRSNYKRWKRGEAKFYTLFLLFDKYGVENCKIYLVEHFPCENIDEKAAREGYWIKTEDCINKKVEGRSAQEHYRDNRDHILEKHQQWYSQNKDKVNERRRAYRRAHPDIRKEYFRINADKIKARASEIINCVICQKATTRQSMSRHQRSLFCQSFQRQVP